MEIVRTPLVLNPPLNVTRVVDDESAEKLIEFLEKTKLIGYDIETTPLKDFYFRRIRTMQFGNAYEQYVVDLKKFCDDDAELLRKCQGEFGKHLYIAPRLENLIKKLDKYLVSSEWIKAGVNLGFEYLVNYWSFGRRIYGLRDAMMREKCIYAGIGGQASLKNYSFYSMEEMFGRYFGMQIDKTLQESFNLEDEISNEQYEYAALDTRTPLGILALQDFIISGETLDSLRKKGKATIAGRLEHLHPQIFGDNLQEICQIEDNAIGPFIDMHLHGEAINVPAWKERADQKYIEFQNTIKKLDEIFLPFVGSKNDIVTEQMIEAAKLKWKKYTEESDEEIQLIGKIREISKKKKLAIKNDEHALFVSLSEEATQLEEQRLGLEKVRIFTKDALKKEASELGKRRTKLVNLSDKCEGEALINYESDAQLKKVLKEHFKPLKDIGGLDDETLEKYNHIPVIKLIQEYHAISKEVGTYGYAWTNRWVTHPCGDEGWLHPITGRLHCEFNQYDAATGRSSSTNPNGQNLPQDKTLRAMFVADESDESIRISDCCNSDTIENPFVKNGHICIACQNPCETHGEEYTRITIDMSGAELRILAEEAEDPIWIKAFKNKEDVHSVCTELVEGTSLWKLWAIKSIAKPDAWTLQDCKDEVVGIYFDKVEGKNKNLYPCAYFATKSDGTLARQKCKCPKHNEARDGMKPTNFGLPYGIGPRKLSIQIGKTFSETKDLMARHKANFPYIWNYLADSGLRARTEKKSFDMFGRRRIFEEPTWDLAKEYAKEDLEKELKLPPEECELNINKFIEINGRKPTADEKKTLTHREPTDREISKAFQAMFGNMERQGKNHRIQSANATIIKIAMGAGFDKDGKPFLFHVFPKYKAKLQKMVHDELGIGVPTRFAEEVAQLTKDAIRRAAAIKMKHVEMDSDYRIMPYWCK